MQRNGQLERYTAQGGGMAQVKKPVNFNHTCVHACIVHRLCLYHHDTLFLLMNSGDDDGGDDDVTWN